MGELSVEGYFEVLHQQTELLAAAVREADPQRAVPTCPDWSLRQLTQHVGRAHRWASAIVEQRATSAVDPREMDDMRIPDEIGSWSRWLFAGADRLVEAIRTTGSDTVVWTWTGERGAGFWARRMVHETVVHRADAELALGRTYTVAAELAADGVSEWLTLRCSPTLAARAAEPPLAAGQLMHLHATDAGLGTNGEWLVHGTPEGIVWEHRHGKGDVAVRAPAVDLLLVIMRRLPAVHATVEMLGDATVFDHWLAHTSF